MMKIKQFIFGPFQTNCYVVSLPPISDDPSSMSILLIDPACSNEWEQQQLLQYISDLQSPISDVRLSIVATHGHLDHLWGAKWATEQWNTPVLMHEADIPYAQAMQQQYELFGIRRQPSAFSIQPISHLQSPISNVKWLHTPGHTPGSVCLYFPEEKVLFSGDTLFQMGYGRTDLPGGNYGQLLDSLECLLALPKDVTVYPGHGDFTTIGAESRWR